MNDKRQKVLRDMRRIRPVFAWYDFYLGYYWDRHNRTLYLMVPMVGIAIRFGALNEETE